MSDSRTVIITIIIVFASITLTHTVQCPPGFDSMPPRVPFGVCVIIGCAKPLKNQPCTVDCLDGFVKTSSNTCQVIKCNSTSKTMCTSCESGYQLQAINGNQFLRMCVPSNCQAYDKLTRACNKCLQGFEIQKNGTCSLVNCEQPGPLQCLKCKQGYSLTKTKEGINICLPKNCIDYSLDTYQCNQCQSSFIKSPDTGICKLGLQNCANFNEISGLCYNCSAGYRLIGLKECIPESQGCTNYDATGCTSCVLQYRAVKGKCVPNFCDQYSSTDPNLCARCEVGYKLNSDKFCEVDNCQNFDKSTWRCYKCSSMFNLFSMPSLTTQYTTVQRCLTRFCAQFDRYNTKCDICQNEYTLSDGKCLLSNCDQPGFYGCDKCADGWRKNINNNCVVYDCLQYTSDRKCKSCPPGKRVYKGMCVADNCVIRNNDGTCRQCNASLMIHSKFTQFCVVPYCASIDETSGDCLQCIANYQVNEKGFCISKTCVNFESIAGFVQPQCSKCVDGFEPNQQVCIASKKYCANFTFETGKCEQCANNYELLPNKTQCSPLKCRSFDEKSTYMFCTQCSLGYRLINYDNGTQRCEVNNCSKFNESTGRCAQCNFGFIMFDDICLTWNCMDYDELGFCRKCYEGFTLNSNLTCIRISCKQDSINSCIKCDAGLFPDKSSNGLCRPYSCDVVTLTSNSIQCSKCMPNFIRLPESDRCTALDCSLIDQNTGLCLVCRPAYSLSSVGSCTYVRNNDYCPDRKYPGLTFACEPIKAKYCFAANPKNTAECYRCEDNFYLNNGNCLPYQNCLQRSYYAGCSKCRPGYKPNKNGQCEGTLANCKSYDDSGQCQECTPGLQLILYPNKLCKPLPDYCSVVDPWGNCMQCRLPNRVLDDNKFCYLQTANCQKYGDAGLCTQCGKGFYLKSDSQFAACIQNPPNCDSSLSNGQCVKCADNFILSAGQCFQSIKNCVSYDEFRCARCTSDYYVSPDSQSCNPIPKYCRKVIMGTYDFCETCNPGFDNMNGICVRSIEFCVNYNTDTGKCVECHPKYTLSQSQILCMLG